MPKPVVAIVGRPNVGKSTLFNRIVGRRKAIVGSLPGITRDRNYAEALYDDRAFLVIDTGGFDPDSPEPIMQQMKNQVQLAVEEAEFILFVMDGKQGITSIDREAYNFLRARSKAVYPVVNKVDGPKQESGAFEFYELGMERLYMVSAEHGLGVADLMEEVVRTFPESEPPVEEGPTRISVIGKPNVGKSTLINALIGENRLITSHVPGTTRDTIDTPFEYNGEPYLLVDTAGIRKKARVTQRIEIYSVIMVLKSIQRSDLCLILVDATTGITDQDTKIAGLAHEAGKASILLVNKWDLVDKDMDRKRFLQDLRYELKFMDYIPILFISALTRKNLRKIFPIVNQVNESYLRRVATAKVNQVLREAVASHEPPFYRRHRVKFFYGTQADVAPPTFILFVNAPSEVHFSYRRYLTNQFREKLAFENVPIRIYLKKRK